MATFPTGIASLTNPSASDRENLVSHSAQHTAANDEIVAIETALGANLANVCAGDGTVNTTNLLPNGDFESWFAGTSTAPDGWSLELTPTVDRDTAQHNNGWGGSYSCKITAAGAGLEGIKFTTGYLRPSSSYTFSVMVKVTAGDTASIITTGGTTNLALESTSTTYELKSGTFVSDGAGNPVTIKLLAKADTDVVWFDSAILVTGASAYAYAPRPLDASTQVVAETDETKFSHKLPVVINGSTYYIMMTAT